MEIDKSSSMPVYRQLADILKENIDQGNMPPGSYVPSENKLAEEYSISRMTARATLKFLEEAGIISCNNSRRRIVNDPLQKKTVDAGVNSDITIVVYQFKPHHYDDIYFGKVLDGVTSGALKNRVNLKFISDKTVLSDKTNLIQYLYKENINAVFRIGLYDFNIQELEGLKKDGFPAIMFNICLKDSGFDFISCDHYQGASMLMDSLCHMGHKKIACITRNKKKFPFAQKRWQAYKDAHERYGLDFEPEWTLEINDAEVTGDCRDEVKKKIPILFKNREKPSAIFISSGSMTQAVIEYLNARKMSIPDDMSIVCFDKMSLPVDMPEVTCVEQPTEKMAEMAIDILMKRIRDPQREPVEITMPPDLLPGNSCGFYTEKK